jgi:hypothetical protein
MRPAAAFIMAAVLALALVPVALADWPHDVKWDQLQLDAGGWGANSYLGIVSDILVADDFLCSETGWITDIEFCGWETVGAVGIDTFWITFWTDVPETSDSESHPGEKPLVAIDVAAADPTDPLGLGWKKTGDYTYKINLPEQNWFRQEQGNTYWIGIQAVMGGNGSFSWMLRDRNACMWGDDAAVLLAGTPPWDHYGWPDAGPSGQPEAYQGMFPDGWDKSADMCFRLTGIPIPEPATLGLVASGLLALALRRRR